MNVRYVPIYFMLILVWTVTLTFFLQGGVAQDYTQISLPEGAIARLGKGAIFKVAYFPDGNHIAVGSSIGVWIYDAHSGEELALYSHHDINNIRTYSFSSDGQTIASGAVKLSCTKRLMLLRDRT